MSPAVAALECYALSPGASYSGLKPVQARDSELQSKRTISKGISSDQMKPLTSEIDFLCLCVTQNCWVLVVKENCWLLRIDCRQAKERPAVDFRKNLLVKIILLCNIASVCIFRCQSHECGSDKKYTRALAHLFATRRKIDRRSLTIPSVPTRVKEPYRIPPVWKSRKLSTLQTPLRPLYIHGKEINLGMCGQLHAERDPERERPRKLFKKRLHYDVALNFSQLWAMSQIVTSALQLKR